MDREHLIWSLYSRIVYLNIILTIHNIRYKGETAVLLASVGPELYPGFPSILECAEITLFSEIRFYILVWKK